MTRRKVDRLAEEVAYWRERLAPEIDDVSLEDLDLVIWSLLRQKYGGKPRFLLRRSKDGRGFVF